MSQLGFGSLCIAWDLSPGPSSLLLLGPGVGTGFLCRSSGLCLKRRRQQEFHVVCLPTLRRKHSPLGLKRCCALGHGAGDGQWRSLSWSDGQPGSLACPLLVGAPAGS